MDSDSTTTKEKFVMRVCNRLLIKLRMNGVDPTEAAVFFGAQAQLMLDCKPNYGPRSAKTTTAKAHQLKKDVWLMRGFYPHTAQMFKISISENEAFGPDYQFFVKVSEPVVRLPTAISKRGLNMTHKNESTFTSSQIRDQLQERLEKEVLNVDIQIDPMISNKVVFTPKSISPKGMKLFKLDLKKD